MTKPTRTLEDPVLSYIFGFLFSVLCTLISFWFAPHFGTLAPIALVLGALVQLFVQLVFFLHLGRGRDSGWNIGVFFFTAVIIFILIGGTLWIMTNLAHLHMHSPTLDELYQAGMIAPQNELN